LLPIVSHELCTDDRAMARPASRFSRPVDTTPALNLSTGTMIPRRAENEHIDAVLTPLDALCAELDRPPLGVRVHVSTHRPSLDEELARGDSPLDGAALALRARQLVARRNRDRLARALARLVAYAEQSTSPGEIVWVPHREILEARTAFLGLADRLRDARPVYARGVAMVSRLIQDGTGPAYTRGAGVALRRAIAAAADALEGRWRDDLATKQ
jgi:hypothetical protein